MSKKCDRWLAFFGAYFEIRIKCGSRVPHTRMSFGRKAKRDCGLGGSGKSILCAHGADLS
jgi:hypothetical protein